MQKKVLLKKLLKNRNVLTGSIILILVGIVAILAPLIAPCDPNAYDVRNVLAGSTAAHFFGTDSYGRDVFSRVLYGARISLVISISVSVLCGIIGTVFGLIAGYYKKSEQIIMSVMDGLMAFPSLLLAMSIVAVIGAGVENLIMALTISNVPRIVRTVRGTVISVKNLDYIEAAKSMGASDARIIFRYILPECISPLLVRLTMTMAFTILEEASLTFLGLGLSPVTPSWGIILSEARTNLRIAPHLTLMPGAVIVVVVYGINVLGDGLRDVLDPKLSSK